MPQVKVGHVRMTRLDAVAEVRGGYIVAGSSSTSSDESVRGLQAGDVAPDGKVAWSALRQVPAPRDPKRYEVRDGDVLLPLRSTRLAAAVARDVPKRVIAIGSWALLTPAPEAVTPEFLAWYLNHPVTGQRLAKLSQGSSLQFLSLGAIREFEIEIPPLEMQVRIARAYQLNSRIAELEQQLVDARKQLVDALTMEALRGRQVVGSESVKREAGGIDDND
jgi:hypothetical protein